MTNIERYQAAPGSYNLSQDLTTRSQVYLNPPRPTIPRGKKQPNLYFSFAQSKESMGLDAPSASKYSPNSSLLFKSTSVSKFGNEKRKDHFLLASDRSPGPIYLYTERNKRTCSFGTGEKLTVKESDEPSPAAYNPKAIKNRLPIKMKGYVSDKVYLKNLENTYKGKIGTGPACYSPSSSPLKKGMKLPQALRLKPSNC